MTVLESGQIFNNFDNFTQYEHFLDAPPICYVQEKNLVREIADCAQDNTEVEERLNNFELHLEIGGVQGMENILRKFTTISSLPDIAFITAEKFNKAFNSCLSMFELHLTHEHDSAVQALATEVFLPKEYADFNDIFSSELVWQLLSHALHDHTIETRDM